MKRLSEKTLKTVEGKSSFSDESSFTSTRESLKLGSDSRSRRYGGSETNASKVFIEVYDVVLADERHKATVQDDVVLILRNAMMKGIVASWVGKPCMKTILLQPPAIGVSMDSGANSSINSPAYSSGSSSRASGSQAAANGTPRRTSGSATAAGGSIAQHKSAQNLQNKSARTPPKSGVKPSSASVVQTSKLKETPPGKKQKETASAVSGVADSVATSATTGKSTNGKLTTKSSIITTKSDLPDWRLSLRDEDVEIVFMQGNRYKGRVSRGMMEGRGEYSWEDGMKYEGEFVGGAMTGRGKLTWTDLSWYEGEVERGWRHGKGLYVIADSREYYYGEWRWGRKHGQGTYFFNDKGDDWYSGQWVDDAYNGYGVRQYISGARYQGQWSDGTQHGTGTMIWANKDVYRGNWFDGRRDGLGEYIWSAFLNLSLSVPEENAYRGSFRDGVRHGYGELTLPNGSLLVTNWTDDAKDGPGRAVCGNGTSVYGSTMFVDDKPTRDALKRASQSSMKSTEMGETGIRIAPAGAAAVAIKTARGVGATVGGVGATAPITALPAVARPHGGGHAVGGHQVRGHHSHRVKTPHRKAHREPKIEWLKTEYVAPENFRLRARQIPVLLPDQEIDYSYHLLRLWALRAERARMGMGDGGEGEDGTPRAMKLKRHSIASGLKKVTPTGEEKTVQVPATRGETQTSLLTQLPKKQSMMMMESKSRSHLVRVKTKTDLPRMSIYKKTVKSMSMAPKEFSPHTPVMSRFGGLTEEEYEIKLLQQAITRHMPTLRRAYESYAGAGGMGEGRPFLARIMLWQFYRDCGFHRRGLSLAELNEMLALNPSTNTSASPKPIDNPSTSVLPEANPARVEGRGGAHFAHEPFEAVPFSTFLHGLMDVAWALYAGGGAWAVLGGEGHPQAPCGVLGGALDKLIVDDVRPVVVERPPASILTVYRDLLPLTALHRLYLTVGEEMTARDFLKAVCVSRVPRPPPPTPPPGPVMRYPDHAVRGENVFALGEALTFLPGETPLACRETPVADPASPADPHRTYLSSLRGVGPARVVRILDEVCPGIMAAGLIVNMDYRMTFLDFLEALVLCADYSLRRTKRRQARMAAAAAAAERLLAEHLLAERLSTEAALSQAAARASRGSRLRDGFKSSSTLGSVKSSRAASRTTSRLQADKSNSNNARM